MSKFYPLVVKKIAKESEDCVSVSFEVAEKLREKFQYKQGQYLTLRKVINGEEVRRSYSLCSSPLENKWQVGIKKVPEGRFSTFANEQLAVGDMLEAMPPTGRFFVETAATKSKHYLMFAAGSGITPILSIIKTHLAVEPNSHIQLFYLNKTAKSILFKEAIEGLKNQHLERFEVFYLLSKEKRGIPLLHGRFTPEKLQLISQKIVNIELVDECFICGPEEMIFLIKEEMQKAGIAKSKIHFELFNAGNTTKNKKKAKAIQTQQAKLTSVTVIDGGKEMHFEMGTDYDNLLDAALAKGADLPYACKGGVCCTCKSKLIEGKVEMKVNYGLDEAELKQGYILSCQAMPTTERVVIDFGG